MEKHKLLSKRRLEIQLGKLETPKDPDLKLEQYPVSPEVASELLYMAGFEHHDLGRVVDLGCGTGRLAIGASLMGAESVVGIDVDERVINIAEGNARKANANVKWMACDLEDVQGTFDSVVMNPPYGTRTPHSDTKFLSHAFKLAPIVYSIHKSSTRSFLAEFVERNGRNVDELRSMTMTIPHLFTFHRKKSSTIEVDVYRIVS